MELDDFKSAWRTLDARLARHDRVQLELLRERKLDAARRGLRWLVTGQSLQVLLGVGLILLGVACWTGNPQVPGLFAAGIALHAFGVLNAALGGLVVGLAGTIDYSAPVAAIQRRMARLQQLQTLNAWACGAPWWIMWLLVVVAFAGLGGGTGPAPTPTWIQASLAICATGLLATWGFAWWHVRRDDGDPGRLRADGVDGIRRGRRLLDELERFERE